VISLAAGTVPECDPASIVRAAVAGGFDASGMWVVTSEWTDATTAEVRAVCDGEGTAILDVEVGRLRAGHPTDDVRRLLDIGAAVGAPFALVVSTDPDLARTADQYAELCVHGRSIGVRPVLEFMRFMTVRTLADALDVVDRAGDPDGAILVDALHLSRCGLGPHDIAVVGATRPGLFPYMQLCDAVGELPPADRLVEEALDGRLLPGDGELPLRALLDALPPGIPVSVELRSKALRDGYAPDERARVVADATRRLIAATA
jgi:sugar phosphate isomerase/epimerase